MVSLPSSSKPERDTFKTIVLGLDGSDGAKRAIPLAAEIAEKEKAKIVIAHVRESLAGRGAELLDEYEDQIRDEINEEAEELRERGIETRVELAEALGSRTAQAIVEIADRNDGDLIVTGTRGHGSVAGLIPPDRVKGGARGP